MSERWYRAIRVYGKTSQIIQRVSDDVRRYNLGDYIPRICVERRRGTRSREFYLFVGIHSSQKGEIPDNVELVLNHLGHASGDFYYDEIKTMVSGEIEIREYARTIAYQVPKHVETPDPFAASVETTQDEPTTNLDSTSFNRFLYWLSATGTGSWNTFHQVCFTLGMAANAKVPRRVFRRLRLLGHVEYLDKGTKWTICPACLVQIGDSQTYFLAGQRALQLVQQFSRIGRVSTLFQPEHQAPDCLQFTFDHESELQRVIGAAKNICEVQLAGNAAYELATILPDLTGWQASLQTISKEAIPIGLYTCQRWFNNTFVDYSFRFETGLYQLMSREDIPNAPRFTLFYDASSGQWLRGDWYGLRFLAQQQSGQAISAHYNSALHQLAIPVDNRWPDLYERSLVLASGLLPRYQDGWLYYTHISVDLCELLAEKLNVQVELQDVIPDDTF